mgnify:CR=1 FL=1
MAFKNAHFNYDQEFFLDGCQLSGVVSIDGGYSIDESPINIIGKGHTFPVRQGSLVGNFNISKYYIGEEKLLDYTGDQPISGSINYGDSSFGFLSGFLTEYSLSAGIGQIPTANASIVVYGDIGEGLKDQGNLAHPPIQIPNQGSILLDVHGFNTNRVSSFDYSIRINREPIYKVSEPFPVQVHTDFPIYQELNVSIDIDNYEVPKISSYLESPIMKDVEISLSNPINDQLIESITIKNARLLSQSIQSSSNESLKLQLSYKGYINRSDRI